MKKHILIGFFALISLTLAACATQVQSSINSTNVDENKIAVKGYDTVAYFTESKAVEGKPQYTAEYQGAIYQFSSSENKALFEGNPQKYAPQYGGYCAFGVTQEKKYDIDPTAFAIVDGKLYLNLNSRAQRVWDRDRTGNIESADDNWINIAATPAADL